MKNLFLFLLVFGTVSTVAQTNIYHPFPDSNATWNFDYTQAQCMFGYAFEQYSITLDGDTLINGTTCQKLFSPYVDFYTLGSCSPFNTAGYKGAIREDESMRKVYLIAPNESTEQLLYDFNLQLGDTIQGVLSSFTFGSVVVESIDSVLIGNDYHKRWNINNSFGISVIEGVGSTYGLINATPGYITDAHMYSLECFSIEGVSQYPDPSADCRIITSVPIPVANADSVSIVPNPSNGNFRIITQPGLKFDHIRILSLQGKLLYESRVDPNEPASVTGFPAGTYLLQLTEENQLRSVKKISVSPGL
jgi:hypothetical protein